MQEEDENHDDNVLKATKRASSCCCNCLFTIFCPCFVREDIVILVIGLDTAGKSTLISTLRKEENHEETPTWGFGQKQWDTRSFRILFYDLGGGRSIRGLWPHYYSKVFGTIFVIDGADDSRLWEASQELKIAMSHPRLARKPFLVVANKINEGSALDYDELMDAIGPFNTNEQAFVYCDCRLQHGGKIHGELQLGLDWLLASIKIRYKELQGRVSFESAKQVDEEQRSLLERRHRSKSYLEEKEAAGQLPVVDLPHLKDNESETHARMQSWIGPDESLPVLCTYQRRTTQSKSIQITTADFEKSLQPLIKQYETRPRDGPTYSKTQIDEYFGDFIDGTTSSNEIPPHLPGQA